MHRISISCPLVVIEGSSSAVHAMLRVTELSTERETLRSFSATVLIDKVS